MQTNFVIYTDKLDDVREFWQTKFRFNYEDLPDGFMVMAFGTSCIMYLDADAHNHAVTENVAVRIDTPHPDLEHNRLEKANVSISELLEASWGESFGKVRYFSFTDPSGTTYELFQPHVDQALRFTLKRDVD